MPHRRKRKLPASSARAAAPRSEPNPDDEEVFSVHTVSDESPPPAAKRQAATRSRTAQHGNQAVKGGSKVGKDSGRRHGSKTKPVISQSKASDAASAVTISDEDDVDDVMADLEEVAIPARAAGQGLNNDDDDLEAELEEVEIDEPDGVEDDSNAYAAAYEAAIPDTSEGADAAVQQPVFKDGKGQPAGITVSISSPARRKIALQAKKNVITAKDRQMRIAAHKWMVLSIISHVRWRNQIINDDHLRDQLYSLVPNQYLEKLRAIHPKKVPVQNERVRQFEALLRDLTRWWSFKFRLEPTLTAGSALRQPIQDLLSARIGKRVDGWIVESAKEREARHRKERRIEANKQKRSTKGKERRESPESREGSSAEGMKKHPLSEITLFGIGSSTEPTFLRLGPSAEHIIDARDLQDQVEAMSGSRETKTQLFTSLLRALGIPSRLVVSVQVSSWSVAAGKIASSSGAAPISGKSDLVKRKRAMKEEQSYRRRGAQRPVDVMTSDDDGFTSAYSAVGSDADTSRSRFRTTRSNGTASRPLSAASTATARSTHSASAKPVRFARTANEGEEKSKVTTPEGKGKGKTATPDGTGKGKAKEVEDYRGEKWRNLETPLEVKFEPKLRIAKPKGLKPGEIEAEALSDVEPIDVSAPPTMWVEVFSKPWQRWITVDPVRGLVEPTGNRQMEPSPLDKSNRLVYVVAFEEDGFARDVTARYTKTLHSRISRMRPPPIKAGGDMTDWWEKVVKTIHRPQKLERDAIEDIELEGAAAREPMPSSVAAFKDHPVYTLEKHLKRDEVIFPARQAGTFQGNPVFLRANVVSCRSARQWYNQGRVVKDGEEALKWVKSRGYTIANKRAEEEARQQGQEGLQEGLYAEFQTQLYHPPDVVEGIIPTNSFGNIDLFVDSMLPKGASHVPYSGAVRVAKKLGIPYAEAITGFEFRKHRSMPKMLGVVVASENAEVLLSALEEDQQMSAEKENMKKQERLFKNWKRLLNSLKIQERIQREYGHRGDEGEEDDSNNSEMDPLKIYDENLERYRDIRTVEQGEGPKQGQEELAHSPGGFLVGDEDQDGDSR